MPSPIDLRGPRQDYLVIRGDAWSVPMEVHEPAPDGTEGPVLDLTNYTITAAFETDDGATEDLDVINDDPTSGLFYFGQTGPAGATASGRYNIRLTAPGGGPRTYMRGAITVTEDA